MTLSADAIVYIAGGIIGSGIAGVIWLVRLEGKIKATDRETTLLSDKLDESNAAHRAAIASLEANHNALALRVVEQLSEIKEALARIEGWMGNGRKVT